MIKSQRLLLLPPESSDWAFYRGLSLNPDVIALCFDPPTESALKERFDAQLTPWKPGDDQWLTFIILESGNPAGVVSLRTEAQIAEIGFMLHPPFQGRGIAKESVIALLAWFDEHYPGFRYKAVVTDGNTASSTLLERCGFVLHQIEPEACQIGGNLYDDLIYYR